MRGKDQHIARPAVAPTSEYSETHDVMPPSECTLINPNSRNFYTIYRGIIYAVNEHIEIAISHSVSECQSEELRKVCH